MALVDVVPWSMARRWPGIVVGSSSLGGRGRRARGLREELRERGHVLGPDLEPDLRPAPKHILRGTRPLETPQIANLRRRKLRPEAGPEILQPARIAKHAIDPGTIGRHETFGLRAIQERPAPPGPRYQGIETVPWKI